jgi:pimeloyl-ACP methyl ester carboxylesterase
MTSSLKPPSNLLLLAEGRMVYEAAAGLLAWPLLRKAPEGDGHPVLVLPGFLASDASTVPLRRFLRSRNLRSYGWAQGRNLGPREGVEEQMLERLLELHQRHQQPVSVVGWSLGGIYARELAWKAPEAVRQVITLGSPFAGDPRANRPWRLFEWLSGRSVDGLEAEMMDRLRRPPPVPATAIFSRSDGVAAWQCCIESYGPQSESIEVVGSHLGLGYNPLVLYAVADRLAQPADRWRPFQRTGIKRYFYDKPLRRRDQPVPGRSSS